MASFVCLFYPRHNATSIITNRTHDLGNAKRARYALSPPSAKHARPIQMSELNYKSSSRLTSRPRGCHNVTKGTSSHRTSIGFRSLDESRVPTCGSLYFTIAPPGGDKANRHFSCSFFFLLLIFVSSYSASPCTIFHFVGVPKVNVH